MKSPVYPELVTGRSDGLGEGRWLVQGGTTMRGQASCNVRDRIIEVPLEDSPTARVVRAHELMHARVSPYFPTLPVGLREIDTRALTVADEFRVNYLLGRLGFDVSLLRDGSERADTKMVAEAGDWNEVVCFLLAVLGTGAEKDYLSGIRAGRKEWTPGLRAIQKEIYLIMDAVDTKTLSDTSLGEDGLPIGYQASVVPIARLLTRVLQSRPPRDRDESRAFERSLKPGARRAPSGRFAELHWGPPLPTKKIHSSRTIKRMRPSPTGMVMRYPSRWLVDEQRRTFAQRAPRAGGIVVVDQSGSMDIEPSTLHRLLHAAPGMLVIGYSHKPGDVGNTPNVWILAQGGRVAIDPPAGNIGNGVDGPVLRYALMVRRGREPVIWVCDGQVTDSNDHPDTELTKEVAELVRRSGIVMVRDLGHVKYVLSRNQRMAPPYGEFGRVGAYLLK